MKKIDKFLKHYGVKDESILELKTEINHLNKWTSSWTYSQILLYLYNLLGCFTYQYNMNRELFSKSTFKLGAKIVKKTFYYVKLVLEVLFIKFDGEELDVFHRLRREFRTYLQEKINKAAKEQINPKPTNLEPDLVKKVKGDSEPKSNSQNKKKPKKKHESDQESAEDSGDEEYVIDKKKKKVETKPITRTKKPKEKHTTDDELKNEIRVFTNLNECLKRVSNHFRS